MRRLTRENDILLIFDEVITGFRVAPGGAQKFYGVIPDLTTYSKNREMYKEFRNTMIEENILWSPNCFAHHGITASHNNKDIQKILIVSEKALKKIKKEF